MLGQMQDRPLLISALIEHADRWHGGAQVVTQTVEGPVHRYTWSDVHRRSRQVANLMASLGVRPGDRVATLAWNTYRHLELYFGVSGSGGVCHTVNPRLFEEQLVFIINDADDQVVCFDSTFAPLVARLQPQCPGVRHWIAMVHEGAVPESTPFATAYEAGLAHASTVFTWPQFDERTASSLCYTSGTTGNPKGVLYSHRSSVLHSYAFALPDSGNFSARDVILPVVPMFHVNAWGIPYGAPMVGATLVLPGPRLDGASLTQLMLAEGVTVAAGVPTIWTSLLSHIRANNVSLPAFTRTVIGGAACPASMIDAFEQLGVEVLHAWGMTETSPLGTLNSFTRAQGSLSAEEQRALRRKQGRVPFGVDIQVVDTTKKPLPRDGNAFGDLRVRGLWVIERYFGATETALEDGWFATGDVATIDPEGFMLITDRSKDVIKSGGEWISSVELENVALEYPGVGAVAGVGGAHPQWTERPLLVVQPTAETAVNAEGLLAFMKERVARLAVPDDVVFVDALPQTATGKIWKLKLREQWARHYTG